jgi:uncharacterized protein
MKQIVLLHGIGGNPGLNWYQYIRKECNSKGHQVFIPQLPDADKPNLRRTYAFLKKTISFTNETILIGHSSGASLALGVLQLLPESTVIEKTILVSGFIDPYLTPELHRYIPRSDYDDLFPDRWDWKKIRKSSRSFVIVHSPSDPFVQMRHPQAISKNVSGELLLIPDAEHFSITSGGEKFKQFPELLEKILE